MYLIESDFRYVKFVFENSPKTGRRLHVPITKRETAKTICWGKFTLQNFLWECHSTWSNLNYWWIKYFHETFRNQFGSTWIFKCTRWAFESYVHFNRRYKGNIISLHLSFDSARIWGTYWLWRVLIFHQFFFRKFVFEYSRNITF